MEIVCQDFFLEFLILNEELTLFIKLSELNKSLYAAVKKYKSHATIWPLLCKRDFKEWIPDNDDQWLFHFPNLKPGNYFGLYCYFDRALNYRYDLKKCLAGRNSDPDPDSILTMSIPLYFLLKKYNGIMNKDFLCIPMSTRKIALVERNADEKKETFIMKEFFNWDCRRLIDQSLTSTLGVEQEILFSYVICQKENCGNIVLLEKTGFYNRDFIKDIHFRDEDNCLPCEDCVMNDRKYVGESFWLGVSKTFGFETEIRFRIPLEGYKSDSDHFKKNKVCSLA